MNQTTIPAKSPRATPFVHAQLRSLVAVGLAVVAVLYFCVFLWFPLGSAIVDEAGEPLGRARFVLGSLLYPENRISSWFDDGRLPSRFSDRLPIAVGSLLWLMLAAIIGLPLIGKAYSPIRHWGVRIEQLSMATLIGLALLSTLTLLIGLAGGLSVWPMSMGLIALVAMVYGHSLLKEKLRAPNPRSVPEAVESGSALYIQEKPLMSIVDRWCFAAIATMTCFLAGLTLLGAWLPPSEFDVLEYHLQAPKEFFQQGTITFLPHNIYANMPLGTEMHSLAIMTLLNQSDTWLGGLIGKSITAFISLVGASLLGAFLSRKFNLHVGWCAAGLWLASPGIAEVAMAGLIDGVLATYVLASTIAVSRALDTLSLRRLDTALPCGDENETTIGSLLTHWRIAGLTAGAAATVKYPGLILAVVPVCVSLAWAAMRWRQVFPLRESALVGLLVVLELGATCGPWYIKNWVFTGNPVYPLAASLFGGKTLTPEKIEQWQRAHSAIAFDASSNTLDQNGGFVKVALKDAKRIGLTSTYVQPAMILGLVLAIGMAILMRDSQNRYLFIWLSWSGWIVFVWWFATHRIDRFWLPATGLWAGSAACGFWWLRQRISPLLAHAVVIAGLGYGCMVNSSPILTDNRYFVSLAALRDDIGDETQVPRISPILAWINNHLSDGDNRILLIGEARAFELKMPIEYSTCFDTNPGEVYLKGRAPDQQLAELHLRGITHILIQWIEIERYRAPGNYGFSSWPEPSDIQELVDNGVASRVDWDFPSSSAELLKVN